MKPARLQQRRRVRGARGRAGFSLVELIVAVMILSIGILGLAATAAVVVRQMGGGAQQTVAAAVAQSRFERLASRPCAQVVSGTAVTRGVTEAWTVTSAYTPDVRRVSNEISFPTRTGTRRITFRSMIRC